MNTHEKMIRIRQDSEQQELVVTHITIRQSITILIFRLFLIEVFAAGSVVMLHTLLFSTEIQAIAGQVNTNFAIFNVPIFILLVIIKTVLTLIVLIQWLNDYYEITPVEVIHNKGLIFRREERFTLKHIASVKMEQGLIGRMFNFGTLKLFNWALDKNFVMYLIHNPIKHRTILEKIIPSVDEEKQVIREHIIEDKDE